MIWPQYGGSESLSNINAIYTLVQQYREHLDITPHLVATQPDIWSSSNGAGSYVYP